MTLAFRCSRRAAHPGQADIADIRVHVPQGWAAVVCTTCGRGRILRHLPLSLVGALLVLGARRVDPVTDDEVAAFRAVLEVDPPAVWDELAHSTEAAS